MLQKLRELLTAILSTHELVREIRECVVSESVDILPALNTQCLDEGFVIVT
jgi:hypothetical protein